MNVPNKLTVARLVIVPIFVALMTFDHVATYTTAYVLFFIASVTDYLDGQIARKHQLITKFGKLMDPVADKVLTAAAFIMMITVPELSLPAWAVIIIIARETLVTGARSVAAGDGAVIAANNWGKAKTLIQLFYITLFLGLVVIARLVEALTSAAIAGYTVWLAATSYWAGVAVALFTLWTGIQFAMVNWRSLDLGDA